ncbi:MAG: mevalonate kinase [Pseudomonadota bacterium]|nr:mevalonate kinase [Pseudomonadota bacterium]
MKQSTTNPDKMMAFASNTACGKAIIVGEHAVIYGAKAVAIPLPTLRTELKLIAAPPPSGSNQHRPLQLRKVVADAFKLLHITPFPFEVKFATNSLVGAGLGSSAAVCVALVRLMSSWIGKDLSDTQVARFANHLEARFHGSPSGLDTAVVSCRAPILFQKNMPPQKITIAPIEGKHRWRFVLVDSGVRSSTKVMVKRAMPYFTSHSVQKFSNCAAIVAKALAKGNIMAVAEAMRYIDGLLREASVTTSHLIKIIERLKTYGVLAAKSTGAGGGGCVLALLQPDKAKQQLQKIRSHYGTTNVYEVML